MSATIDIAMKRISELEALRESMEMQRTAMLDALRVTEGNVASLAATTPAVYGVWLEVVRAAIATGEAKS